MKDLLGLPAHNEKAGICFKCPAKPEDVGQVHSTASWRQAFFSQWSFMERFFREARPISPVWAFPGFTLSAVRLDWLHIVDLGIAADTCGNILWQLQEKMEGDNIKDRLATLFLLIRAAYKRHGVDQDTLATLTQTMIRKDASSPPKLKAKGAEVRRLVPILAELCHQHLDSSVPVEEATIAVIHWLLEAYNALNIEPYMPYLLEDAAKKFALQYVALKDFLADGIHWRPKPKLHVFMHLAASDTNPKELWCYRDEDFGGAAAAMVRAKGGWNTPKSSSEQVLDKFRAKNSLPVLTS